MMFLQLFSPSFNTLSELMSELQIFLRVLKKEIKAFPDTLRRKGIDSHQ